MSYFILHRLIPIFIGAYFLFALVRTQVFKNLKKKSFYKREMYLYLFVAYLAAAAFSVLTPGPSLEQHGVVVGLEQSGLVNSALSRFRTGQGINLKPFHTISNYHKYSTGLASFLNLWGNIFLFMPYGFGLLLFFKKFHSFKNYFIINLLTTFGIEFLQIFVNRSVDIDDVILNLVGGMLSWFIYKLLAEPLNLKRFSR